MNLEAIIQSIYILFLVGEVALLLYAIVRRKKYHTGMLWFAATVVPTLAVTAIQLLPSDWILTGQFSRDFLIWLGLFCVSITFAGMVFHDIARGAFLSRLRFVWLVVSLLWVVAFIVAIAFIEEPFIGWASWTDAIPALPSIIASVGGGAYGLFILGVCFYYFYVAPMPEVANRSAFWIVTSGLFIASIVLISSSTQALMLSGTVVMYTGLSVAIYGIRNYRLADIRDTILLLARTASVIAISWALIFATLYFLARLNLLAAFNLPEDIRGIIVLAGIALGIAAAIVPARQVIEYIFKQIMLRTRPNLASATAYYSQRVARAATLEEVVNATTETLNKVMGVRQSALILINNTVRVQDAVELIVLETGATLNKPSGVGYLHKKSPIYQSIAVSKVPLGQYDIDYGPTFQKSAPQERQFFRDMQMSAYVPVLADNRLIGLLASGPKINDTPYHREDVELLSVIGQQVGTALRSARLIDDLQHLNDSMRVLNKRLEEAKMELEKLDSIKTDFITIASHELRTPLAQIRGYTDIIDSLNNSGTLQAGQATQMVDNLRKSTERMEELISAMLDVSQIDVNSMDLRFVRTTPETVIKMALEPMRDPAKERNITVTRNSVVDLPNIEADLQRMVQALRNIILNAIKFTPDGGAIDIQVKLEPARRSGEQDTILFIIKDTGIGVAEKDKEFIFNKFYRGFDTQLHSTGIYKFLGAGPGLGLTIAKGIIEGHGGEIWVESPGQDMNNPPGSTFYVRLPIEPPAGKRRVLPFKEDVERTQGIPDMDTIG